MPAPYPKEFRETVVQAARVSGDPKSKIAEDFGVHEGTVTNWLNKADREDGITTSGPHPDPAETVELKRRLRVLEQENEILRRAAAFFAKDISPK
jgi:transposase